LLWRNVRKAVEVSFEPGARGRITATNMIQIAPSQISAEALNGVIEAYVLREGTDYGHRDYTLEEKCEQVRAQLERGEVELWFDADNEYVHLRSPDSPD
jgi:uncharacterized protein YheU (UPF0270 family)